MPAVSSTTFTDATRIQVTPLLETLAIVFVLTASSVLLFPWGHIFGAGIRLHALPLLIPKNHLCSKEFFCEFCLHVKLFFLSQSASHLLLEPKFQLVCFSMKRPFPF